MRLALPVRHEQPAPVRWDPFAELDRMHREITEYLASWRFPDLFGTAFTPLADLEETDDAYVVEVEVPGVKRDDIDVEVVGRQLRIRGERTEKERVGILRRKERTVGRFAYDLTLPGDVDADSVTADLADGVLTVRLPKPADARPRRVPIG